MIIIWMGILNALRGFSFGDKEGSPPLTKKQKLINLATSKGMFSIVSGISIAHYLGYYHELAAVSAVGVLLWCMKGWGTALNMTHENPSTRPYEPESKLLDKLAFKLSGVTLSPNNPYFRTDSDAIKYSMVWTSLRGLYVTPLFVALAVIAGDPRVALCSLSGLLMGPAYWLGGPLLISFRRGFLKGYGNAFIDSTRIVELVAGAAVLGLGIWCAGWLS